MSICRFARSVVLAALACCGAAFADVVPIAGRLVYVRVAAGCEGMGSVSGGNKGFFSGSKTTIRATAAKGGAFEGWYLDGSLVSREANYTFLVGESEMVTYEARFIAARDDWLRVWGEDADFHVGETIGGHQNLGDFFHVDSGSAPAVKIVGLPSGVKYDAKSQTISGAPMKRGVFYVTCSAQNGNGYKQTCIAVWNVGGASSGDYDNIGFDYWFDFDVLCNLEVGAPVSICSNLKSISGLPAGLKFRAGSLCDSSGSCTACSGFITGAPTKAGAFKTTFTDYANNKAVKTLVVVDGGSGYVDVGVRDGQGGRGTVSGAGVYTAGATVRLSARPSSGYYFAGWYEDAACTAPFPELADWRKANDTFVFTPEMDGMCLYACFVSKDFDDISISGADSWNIDDSYSYSYEVASRTLPTVSVKGLPAGMKWDKDGCCLLVSDRMKLKPGTTVATITAKNLSGRTATKTVRIVVPNLQSWVFDGLDYSDNAYSLTVGVSDACVLGWVVFGYDSDFKVSATGLPPGLRIVFRDGSACVRGTPTKIGAFTVTLTAKWGSWTEKATFTINVDPLPEHAVGTFNGVLRDEHDNIFGTFTFTASANGRLSAKVFTCMGAKSLSASAWNCYDEDGNPTAYFSTYSRGENFSFLLTPKGRVAWNCEHQLEGTLRWSRVSAFEDWSYEAVIDTAQRNPFSKTGNFYDHPVAVDIAESLASEYKSMKMVILRDWDHDRYYLECANCVAPGDYDTATLNVNKNGMVTITGKLLGYHSFTVTVPLTFDTACGLCESTQYGQHYYALAIPAIKAWACAHTPSGDSCSSINDFFPIYWFPLGR